MSSFLDWLADLFHRLLVGISHALTPVALWLDDVTFFAQAQLGKLGVPEAWHLWIIGAVWLLLIALALWGLRGWWRIAAAACVAVVALRYFQVLPII